MAPFQGSQDVGGTYTQGGALGYIMLPFQGDGAITLGIPRQTFTQ